MYPFLIVTGVLLVGLIGFEILARKTKISQAIMRKLIHVGMCFVVIGFSFLFEYRVMIWSGLFFVVLLAIARLRFRLHSLRDRRNESWGEIFFPLGISLAALIAPNELIFIAAMLILTFSDTNAYIIGKRYPKSRQILQNRTIAGSGAGFITSLFILLLLQFSPFIALFTAVCISISEVFSMRGLDNVTMPVTAALALAVLAY